MKPNVKKLVQSFSETATIVKTRLKKSGFVVPVAHDGGIKFKHCHVKKNKNGWYDVSNLHNPKIKYYTDICSVKVAVALSIYLGLNIKFNEREVLEADHTYMHYFNEMRIFNHMLTHANKANNNVKADMFIARIEEYRPKYDAAKKKVWHVLNKAEKHLFETK